jgi:hypothetical protein
MSDHFAHDPERCATCSGKRHQPDAASGYLEAISLAVALQEDAAALLGRIEQTMITVSRLAPAVDRETLLEGYEQLRDGGVPFRKPIADEVRRNRVPAATPGWTCRRGRRSGEPWPIAPSWVYLLLSDDDDVLYVGKSDRPKTRLTDHNGRGIPWTQVELIACESSADAFRLEADLIRKNAPPWNVQNVHPPRRNAREDN